MFKKSVAIVLIVSMIVSLCGCGKQLIVQKSNDDAIVRSGYNVLDYCKNYAEILDVLEKVEIPPKPEDYGEIVIPVLKETTISVAALEEVSDDDIQHEIDEMIKKTDRYVPTDRETVENGDEVNIDFVGSIDGVEFDGGKAENYNLVIGSQMFIDNFEEQLIDKKVGEEVDVHVDFPQEYGASNLAGKTALFKVKINSISEHKVDVYDDAFRYANSKSKSSSSEIFEQEVKEILEGRNLIKFNYEARTELENVLLDKALFLPSDSAGAYYFAKKIIKEIEKASGNNATLKQLIDSNGMTVKDYVYHIKQESTETCKSMAIIQSLAKKYNIDNNISEEDRKAWFDVVLVIVGMDIPLTLENMIQAVGIDTINEEVLKAKVYDEALKEVIIETSGE